MNTLLTILITGALVAAVVVMLVGPGREGPTKL
jgi:hypothetical protein